MRGARVLCVCLGSFATLGCGPTQTYEGSVDFAGAADPTVDVATTTTLPALTVSGNKLMRSGSVFRLLGVDRSGAEFACVNGTGFFDGPTDDASINAITAWHA